MRRRRITRRRMLGLAASVPILLLLFCLVTIAVGWIRAPALVAREMAKVERPLRASDLPGLAKLPQSLFAIGLDAMLSKDDLLTLFLNRGYLGTVEGCRPAGWLDVYYEECDG